MSTKEIMVWTLFYTPFVMGGKTWQPKGIMVEADGPHDLGKGFSGYIVTAPNGDTYIAESESGAFVGPNLELVRRDVREGPEEIMKEQVEQAKKQSVELIDPEEFWRRLTKSERSNPPF